MPKNIAVFSDGTSLDGTNQEDPSNVFRLFEAAAENDQQIRFYERGVGTSFPRLAGLVAGFGISAAIKSCYQFITDNYENGDKIYLFGFSRGATAVRSLSSFMSEVGILRQAPKSLINEAYQIYRIKNREESKEKLQQFFEQNETARQARRDSKIEFLGVWDTVKALGIRSRTFDALLNRFSSLGHRFHNLLLSPSVKIAYQALSIDERFRSFRPELWEATSHQNQTMRQQWFIGVHTDIGGGIPETGLSDIPLQWITHAAVESGLILPKPLTLNPNAQDVIHNPRDTVFQRIISRITSRNLERSWPEERTDLPVISSTVLQRKDYNPWILQRTYRVSDEE